MFEDPISQSFVSRFNISLENCQHSLRHVINQSVLEQHFYYTKKMVRIYLQNVPFYALYIPCIRDHNLPEYPEDYPEHFLEQ